MSSLVLSDDELVAVVASFGGQWPVPLPTVAVTGDELSRAADRGLRSLALRDSLGALDAGGQPDASAVHRAARSALDVFAYRAAIADPGVPNGPSVAIFAPAADDPDVPDSADGVDRACVVDTVVGRGLHAIETVPVATAQLLLAQSVSAALAEGVDGDDADPSAPGNAVFIIVPGADTDTGVADVVWLVAKGRLEKGTFTGTADSLRFERAESHTAWTSAFGWPAR